MFLVGLTGAIGSGKSTVSAMLANRGAAVIDADLIAREVTAPGGRAYRPVVERFGRAILDPDGEIDRPALAGIVFRDEAARKDLEAITHPAVGQVMLERIADHTESDRIVVLDIPLLAEKGRMGVQAVVVVDCSEDLAVERLVRLRHFDEDDARRRLAVQLGREQRRHLADYVVVNEGSLAELEAQVDELWQQLAARARTHVADV